MARYTASVCRLCRREGAKLFLKGTRCYTKKCSFERRPSPPGQHAVRRRKVGEYGLQLREKQKVRRVYGVLERQFRNYFRVASTHSGRDRRVPPPARSSSASTTSSTGWASRRRGPRPASSSATATSPSTASRPTSRRSSSSRATRSRSASRAAAASRSRSAKETLKNHQAPEWLSIDAANLAGTVADVPRRDQMPLDLNEQLVVEYYSR